MRIIEFKKLEVGSVFKVVLYLMIIPMVLMSVIGLFVAIIGGFFGAPEAIIFGIMYLFMPVVLIFMYAGISALVALIYNLFAKKFGGLEVYIDDKSPKYMLANNQINKIEEPINNAQNDNVNSEID